MKIIKFLFATLLNVGLIYALNSGWGSIPPIGKFIDPFEGFWSNAETSAPELMEQLSLEGLREKVTVRYDSNLIPHIFADNEYDLYYTQGYVTARHRLWQMEFQTHAAAGRIAEIVGPKALDLDRAQRRKGLNRAARLFADKALADPQTKEVITAYTEGVNAFIASLEYAQLPVEYKLLNYKPEEWSAYKSALLLKYMANMLSSRESDLEYTYALEMLGKDTFDILYPDVLPIQEPIVDKANKWEIEPVIPENPGVTFPQKYFEPDSISPPAEANIQNREPALLIGSNNWAVSGKKTASGYPILCNDPHLGLNLPSIWFALQLTAPGVNTFGVSLPGSPNVILGFNDSTAWGVTNAQRDVVDWYAIKFENEKRERYWLDGKWEPTELVVEEIKIKGREKPYLDSVRYTHWGPVTYDDNFKPGNIHQDFAMKWTAHDVSEEVKAFYKLNRADNYQDYLAAIPYYENPAQNIVFASASGDIAIWVQGKYPVKWENQGKFGMDGSRSSQDWQGYIPQEHLVHQLNPERGFVSSANQHPVDTTYPYYSYDHNYEYYRNRRLNQVLDSLEQITPQDMMRLQNDNFNLLAHENLPYWMSQLNDSLLNEAETEAFNVLLKWNYYNDANQIGASYFNTWQNTLYSMVWDELEGQSYPLIQPNRTNTFYLLMEKPDFAFFDQTNTTEREVAADLIQLSFARAAEKVKSWQEKTGESPLWGNFKDTYLQHLTRQAAFNITGINNGGGRHIVNATSQRHGPSWRMVVALSPNGPETYFSYPGGQSGNPGSPFYGNLVQKWESGEYFTKSLWNKESKESMLMAEQTLQPNN